MKRPREEYIENVKLIIDSRESVEFDLQNVAFEKRQLSIGDFTWIGISNEDVEYVLDVIIERKTLSDLFSSIRTGRYREQKHRLKTSNIKHTMYWLEKTSNSYMSSYSSFKSSIMSAILSTCQIDKFTVTVFNDLNEMCINLIELDNNIRNEWIGKNVSDLQTYKEFQETNKKRKKLSFEDTFIVQLSLCKGISDITAQAIVKKHKTFYNLYELYNNPNFTEKEKEDLLHNTVKSHGRSINKNSSMNVYKFFK